MTLRRRGLTLVAAGVAGLTIGAAVIAQTSTGNYDLSWRALAGGGSSAGGSYTEQGAIGQAFTGSASGGSYAVGSGYLGGGAEKYRRFLPVLSKD